MIRKLTRQSIILLTALILAGCSHAREPMVSHEQSEASKMTEVVRMHIAASKGWRESDYSIEMNRVEEGNWVFWVVHNDDLAATYPGGGKSVEVHVDPKSLHVSLELGFQ